MCIKKSENSDFGRKINAFWNRHRITTNEVRYRLCHNSIISLCKHLSCKPITNINIRDKNCFVKKNRKSMFNLKYMLRYKLTFCNINWFLLYRKIVAIAKK